MSYTKVKQKYCEHCEEETKLEAAFRSKTWLEQLTQPFIWIICIYIGF